MLRSHGMVREMSNDKYKEKYNQNNNDLMKNYLFYPAIILETLKLEL